MESFFKSTHCGAHVHCRACRTNSGFRDSIRNSFEVPDGLWECPEGLSADDFADGKIPPLVERAFNALKAASKVVSAAVQGKKIKVSDEEQAKRRDICGACDFLTTKNKDGSVSKRPKCSKCGCVKNWKTMLETERCPLNPPKW